MTVYSTPSKQLTYKDILKIKLVNDRAVYLPGWGKHVICPVCEQPMFRDAMDLHEAILTRGKVQGAMSPEEALKLISHPCNCVLRHHICPDGNYHTSGTGGDAIFEKCVKQIVAFEGLINVIAWLMQMEEHFPHAASEARLRVEGIFVSTGFSVTENSEGE